MYSGFFILLTFIGICMFEETKAMSQEQFDSMSKGMRKSCTNKVPVDIALVDAVKTGQFADNTDLKCYMRCVLKMTKGIKNGKIDTNMIVAQMSVLPKNSERLIVGAKKCSAEAVADDECELSFLYVKCLYENDPEVFFFP